MDENVYDVKLANIDKCIGRIDDQMDKHESRIQCLEQNDTKIFERLGGLIKVLWVVAAGMISSMIYAIMKLILI
jgi:hypothetical protein